MPILILCQCAKSVDAIRIKMLMLTSTTGAVRKMRYWISAPARFYSIMVTKTSNLSKEVTYSRAQQTYEGFR